MVSSKEKKEIKQEISRELRKNMTPQERKLWYCYCKKSPYHWRRQHIVDGFILDFYCGKLKLAIELDGIHHLAKGNLEYDKGRTKVINDRSITVIRFMNNEIDYNFDLVCKSINNTIATILNNYDNTE